MSTDYPNTSEFLKGLFAQGANIMSLQSKQGADLLDAMRSDLKPAKGVTPALAEKIKRIKIGRVLGEALIEDARTYRESIEGVQQPSERWTDTTHHSLGNGCYQSRRQGGAQ